MEKHLPYERLKGSFAKLRALYMGFNYKELFKHKNEKCIKHNASWNVIFAFI